MNNRYDRNIDIKKIGKKGQKKLNETSVFVAGCGGLGSGVITNLASMGIGKIGILDFDTINISNLNRQILYNVKDIGLKKTLCAKKWINNYNPEIKVDIFDIKMENNNTNFYEDLIKPYNIVVDCFDDFSYKLLLNEICNKQKKIFIHSGVFEFKGQVMTVFPGKSACLNCIVDKNSSKNIKKNNNGIVSPCCLTIASIEAFEVLKVVLNFENILINKILFFDLLKMNYNTLNVEKNNKCKVCL